MSNSTGKTVGIIVGSVLLLTVLGFGINGLVKASREKREKEQQQLDGDSSSGGTGSGYFNPDPLAKEIKKNIEGWNARTYPETAKKILLLSDNNLRTLYAHYNSKYAKEYPTLTQLFENEWSDWDGYYGKVASRLKKLKLY